MTDSNKSAVIGARDIIQIFEAVGFDTFNTGFQTTTEIFDRIKNEYSLIITTEDVGKEFEDQPYPIVLNIGGLL